MRTLLIIGLIGTMLLLAAPAGAMHQAAPTGSLLLALPGGDAPDDAAMQKGGGKSLGEAIEQVRRQHKGGRILSAETRTSGNREVHHIKVLTKDGKVKTVRVNGRRLDR